MKGPRAGGLALGSACLALGALGLGGAFPPWDQGWLAWVALVPGFAWMEGRSGRAVAVYFLALGLAYFGIGLSWYAVVYPPGHLALAVLLAPSMAAAGLLAERVRRVGRLPGPVGIAAAWVLVDLVRSHLLGGFPWLLLGHTQHRYPVLIQIADLGGVHAVTFVLVLGNASLAAAVGALLRGGPGRPARLAGMLAPAAGVVALTAVYGVARLSRPADPPGPRLVGIQANIPVSLKHDPIGAETILRRHLGLTDEAVGKGGVDLVIWSETMYPAVWDENDPGASQGNRALLRGIAGRLEGASFLVGVNVIEAGPSDPLAPGYRQRNRALLLDPEGREVGSYDKRHLVPLGEYLPGGRWLPLRHALGELVRRIAGWYPALVPGRGSPVLELPASNGAPVPFGVMICYDSVFPDVARRAARDGARFLVNLSNDAWYGTSAELDQILAITAFRAVETRLPLFRVTNSGISAAVDSSGRVVERLRGRAPDGAAGEKGVAGVLVRRVGLGRGGSPYVRVGDFFALACGALALAGALRRRRRRPEPF